MNGKQLRRRLVDELRVKGALTDDAVAEAFLAVPRERFIPEVRAAQGLARVYQYDDFPTRG
jgi:protein-L-isoaspartate O-methyltransferase